MTLRQAKQILQQTESKTQVIAQQEVGRLATWAENQHAKKMEQERLKLEKANQRAKKAETEARNAEHTNQRTPDNRPMAKRRAGPSPQQQLPVIPPFPTGKQASGSQDNNPESQHEPTGRRGRPRNTQEPRAKAKAKAKAKAASVRQETFTKNQTQSTTHGTQKDENKSRSYWENIKNKAYFVDQLNHRKWNYPRTRTGRPKVLTIPQLRTILFEIDPSINQK